MYFSEKYNRPFFRPTCDIDPKQKASDPNWSRSMVEYIYSQYMMGNCAITKNDVERFNVNLSYAKGRQDTSIYKDMILDEYKGSSKSPKYSEGGDSFNPPKTKKARQGWVSINFDNVFSPMPKYINTIIGIMEGQEHNIHVSAIDEHSAELRDELKYKRYVQGKYMNKLAIIDNLMGIEHQEENIIYPSSIEELRMFEEMGEFKLTYEIGIQRAVDHTMKASGDKKIKTNVIKDAVTFGIASTMDYFDYDIGEVRAKHLDVRSLIVEKSKEDDFSDASFWAYIDYINIAQLKSETGLKDDELFAVAGNFFGKLGNMTAYDMRVDNSGSYDYYACKVPVLVAYWISNDSVYHTTRNVKGVDVDFVEPYRANKGGAVKLPRVYDTEGKKTTKTTSQSLYSCKWIVDTDVVYNIGKAHDVAFDYEGKKVESPIRVYKIDGMPMVENCIPIVDQIALTYYRLQNGIAKAPPPGLKIEYNSMLGMTFEDDDEWKPLDGLRLYTQSGHIIFNASPSGVELPPNMPDPIQELKGGLGTVIKDAADSLALAYQQLMEITGIDRLSASSISPSRDQGKYVTEVAVAATTNALRPIYSCYLSMKEQLARSIALRVQAVILGRDDTKYHRILGDAAVEALRVGGFFPPISLGVHLVAMPDEVMKNAVREAAMAALAGGKNGIPALSYSEYLFIIEQLNTNAGLYYARVYIARKEAETQMQAQQRAESSQKLLSQETMRQNEQKAKQELDKLNQQKNNEIELLNVKSKLEKEMEMLRHENKMKELEIINQNNINNE